MKPQWWPQSRKLPSFSDGSSSCINFSAWMPRPCGRGGNVASVKFSWLLMPAMRQRPAHIHYACLQRKEQTITSIRHGFSQKSACSFVRWLFPPVKQILTC